jgi:hypothetical protein
LLATVHICRAVLGKLLLTKLMTNLTTMPIFKNETSYDRTWLQSNKKISWPAACLKQSWTVYTRTINNNNWSHCWSRNSNSEHIHRNYLHNASCGAVSHWKYGKYATEKYLTMMSCLLLLHFEQRIQLTSLSLKVLW